MAGRSAGRRFLAVALGLSLLSVGVGESHASFSRSGRTEVVSVSSSEKQGNACELEARPGECSRLAGDLALQWGSSISANGRFVAFSSDSSGLAEPDINGLSDVFLRDRRTGTTELISISSDGRSALGPTGPPLTTPLYNESARVDYLSYDPSTSADGRFVAFASDATNLVPEDTNLATDVFVRDRKSGVTTRVSVGLLGQQSAAELLRQPDSFYPSISASGRFVSFTSWGSNLVPGDTNGWPDVFVHDRKTGRTERVSVASEGRQSSMRCGADDPLCLSRVWLPHSSISTTGGWVVFDSDAPDLVDGDTNGASDVFVHDRKADSTERVSVGSQGEQAARPTEGTNCNAPCPMDSSSLSGHFQAITSGRNISSDGRLVVFVSGAENLVPNDRNYDLQPGRDGVDVFVHDRKTGRTERVSVTSAGEEAQPVVGASRGAVNLDPSMTPDGRYIVWHTGGLPQNLVDRPFEAEGVFLHDRKTGATEYVSWMAEHVNEEFTGVADISANGRFVSYASPAWYRDDGEDDNPGVDIFVRDRGTEVGAGGSEAAINSHGRQSGEDLICLASIVCLPAQSATGFRDGRNDVSFDVANGGAELTGVSVAHRSQDLFVRLKLKDMSLSSVIGLGSPATLYGFEFMSADTHFQVRAHQLAGNSAGGTSFGLFKCDGRACAKVRALRGGYGTTGEEVVFSIPLDALGLSSGGTLYELRAFTALGTSAGPVEILDSVALN